VRGNFQAETHRLEEKAGAPGRGGSAWAKNRLFDQSSELIFPFCKYLIFNVSFDTKIPRAWNLNYQP